MRIPKLNKLGNALAEIGETGEIKAKRHNTNTK